MRVSKVWQIRSAKSNQPRGFEHVEFPYDLIGRIVAASELIVKLSTTGALSERAASNLSLYLKRASTYLWREQIKSSSIKEKGENSY